MVEDLQHSEDRCTFLAEEAEEAPICDLPELFLLVALTAEPLNEDVKFVRATEAVLPSIPSDLFPYELLVDIGHQTCLTFVSVDAKEQQPRVFSGSSANELFVTGLSFESITFDKASEVTQVCIFSDLPLLAMAVPERSFDDLVLTDSATSIVLVEVQSLLCRPSPSLALPVLTVFTLTFSVVFL